MWITPVRMFCVNVLVCVVRRLRSFDWTYQSSHERHSMRWHLDKTFVPNALLIENVHPRTSRLIYPHWLFRLADLARIWFVALVRTTLLPLRCEPTLDFNRSSCLFLGGPNLLASPSYLSRCPINLMRTPHHYSLIFVIRGNNHFLQLY